MVKTKKSVFCRGVAFMSLAWRFEIDQLVLNDFYVVKIEKKKSKISFLLGDLVSAVPFKCAVMEMCL